MKRKHTVLLVGVGITCFAVGGVVAINKSDPYGQLLRSMVPPADAERPDTSPFSKEWHEDNARLTNDIARKSRWSSEDIEFARSMLQPWPDEPEPKWDTDQDGAEALILHHFMLAIVADRVRSDIPTDDSVLLAWNAYLTASLNHPQDYMREAAVSAVINAGSPSAEHLALVRAMNKSDPSERVRRMTHIKLSQFDGQPVDIECPTCPKGGDN